MRADSILEVYPETSINSFEFRLALLLDEFTDESTPKALYNSFLKIIEGLKDALGAEIYELSEGNYECAKALFEAIHNDLIEHLEETTKRKD